MESYSFIFSSEKKHRFRRHFSFWLFWWLFFGLLYSASPFRTSLTYVERLPATLLESLLFLTSHIFISYALMYFVLPVYLLKNKYLAVILWTISLFFITAVISSLISLYVVTPVRKSILPQEFVKIPTTFEGTFFMGLLAGLRGGITIAGLAVAIKLMKHWYIKEQRNLQLQKENAESQLQLLKAQIHPHFLFNTLNNIYSYTQNSSPVASKLVMGLSDMLRYILYEGNQALVPLAKELKMIEEYISIEEIRYGNKLELHINIAGDTRNLYIAPLLLLPFIENCFKHGTSKMLEQPWLNLEIGVSDDELTMKLLNGKLPGYAAGNNHSPGIGINNAHKRLQLLYPGKYELSVTNEEEVFIVNLKVALAKEKQQAASYTGTEQHLTSLAHA